MWSGATEYAQRPPLVAFSISSSRKLEAARDTRLSTLWRVSVQCGILGTLLVALSKRRANTPAQDRTQLGVAELVNGAVVSGGTLVVFAAKDGHTALDGDGWNSPFAIAVAQRIATPGVEISKVFRLVRDDVMEATAGRQEPYTYGSLPGNEDYFFVKK